MSTSYFFFFFQAEDGIRDKLVTGVQTCALPIFHSTSASGYCARTAAQSSSCGNSSSAVTRRTCSSPVRLPSRSEEHTSELQSLAYLVCRLLLEKKKKKKNKPYLSDHKM